METNTEPDFTQKTIKPSEVLVLVGALLALFVLDYSGLGKTVPKVQNSANSAVQLTSTPLNIIAPNGNEVWQFGSTREIKWQTDKIAPTVDVFLINEDGQQLYRQLLSKAENDGSEKWVVDMPPGRYKVQMQTCPGCAGGSSWDTSNSAFTVTASDSAVIPTVPLPANESLVFYSPTGGEIFYKSEKVNIKWFGGYEDWQLKLTLVPVSASSSKLPLIIGEGIQNDGKYEWEVPAGISMGDYYLKMECSNCKSGQNGTSNYTFNYFTLKDY